MNPHEFCITDRFETDNRPRKGLAKFADLQQRSTGIHRSVDDKRGAADDKPQSTDRAYYFTYDQKMTNLFHA